MAVIRKIRNYSGLLIAVIGFALAAFVLGDFFGYGPVGGQRFDLGKVEKNAISYQEFERRASEQLENWKAETGMQNVGQREAFQVRQQVWNQMVREILLGEEMERLGLQVSPEELFDMIHGKEPHQIIIRSFSDPQTGSYDPQQVTNFLRNFDRLDPTVRNQWINLEAYMKQERVEHKYHRLISGAFHVPELLAAKDYRDRNASVSFRYVHLPYGQIADSLVRVTDRDLRRIYDKHKEQFRQEATRSIEYVAFNVFPTEEDRDAARQELLDLKDEFERTENIAPFVNSVSDRRFDPGYYGSGSLSPELEEALFDAATGTIHGPFIDNNAYVLAKLTDVQFRPDSMRASHILIAYAGSMAATQATTLTYEQAEQKADSILNVARRNPARFAALASELSDDPSAAMNNGDLDWFPDGAMVAPFNEAVVEASTGSMLKVETDFGFHVVHVTGKASPTKKIQVARLARDIEPSSRTYQNVYARASEFASLLRKNKNFSETANEKEMTPRPAENIQAMDFSLPGIDNARPIIQWAFYKDTKEGSYSRIFELENRFIIATVTEMKDEGIPSLEQVRDEVYAMALKEKKHELIAGRIKEAGDMTAIAQLLDRRMEEATNIPFGNNLPGIGNEPAVVATAFALPENTASGAIKGNNGVFVLETISKQLPETPEDLTATVQQMRNNFRNRVPNEAFQAIKNNARIEDNREMFY
jgi:peptidyl-prolyl cis-trans isomerase D